MSVFQIDRVGSALSAAKSGLGTGLKYLLGEKTAPWLLPTFGAAAAAPLVGYELDGARRAEAQKKLEEKTKLEAVEKMAKFAALTELARKQAAENSLTPAQTMQPQAPKAVLTPYPKIRAAGLKAALTPATK